MTEKFPRERRIVKTDEFSSVFRLRPVHRTPHFVLYARPNSLLQPRIGIVVAKRFAPRAATRNAIKRITREIFRRSCMRRCDYIVRLSAPVNAKSQPAISGLLKSELQQELLRLLSSHTLGAAD